MQQEQPGLLLYPWKSSSTGGVWHTVTGFEQQKYPGYFIAPVSSDKPGLISWLQIHKPLHIACKPAVCCNPRQLRNDPQPCFGHDDFKGLGVHETHDMSGFAQCKTSQWCHHFKLSALSMVSLRFRVELPAEREAGMHPNPKRLIWTTWPPSC